MQIGAVNLLRVVRMALRRVLESLHGQRDKRPTVLALHMGWLLKGGCIRGEQKVISQCLQRFIAGFLGQERSGEANQHSLPLLPGDAPGCRPARTCPRLCECCETLSSSRFLQVSANTQVASGVDDYVLRRRGAAASGEAEENL
jgi:hypothetical protein